jgi:hypothetical protein
MGKAGIKLASRVCGLYVFLWFYFRESVVFPAQEVSNMLKLKKTAVAAVLGVGCVASAQAWYEGSLGTLGSNNELAAQNVFSLFSTPLVSVNTNIMDWYTFSVGPGVSSATGALTLSSSALISLDVALTDLTFSVYEGTYTDSLGSLFPLEVPDVVKVALLNPNGPTSVGSFKVQRDGTLSGTFDFNPAVSNYTLVVSGVTAGVSLFGSSDYTFTMSAVSEPAEYAMLLAGLGIIGMVARRRKAK